MTVRRREKGREWDERRKVRSDNVLGGCHGYERNEPSTQQDQLEISVSLGGQVLLPGVALGAPNECVIVTFSYLPPPPPPLPSCPPKE